MISALLSILLQAAWPGPVDIDPQRFTDHIKELASDEYEGRGPATPGEKKTVAYIAREFRDAGLQPAGEDSGWFQDVRALRFTVSGEPVVRWTGVRGGGALRYESDIIPYSRKPGAHVAIADAPVVFAGYAIDAPERGWSDFKDADLKGKLAIVLVNEPDFGSKEGRFDGAAVTAYGMFRTKAEALAKRGALGVLFVHDEAAIGWGWRVAETSFTQPQFDIERGGDAKFLDVEGWLHADAAARLVRSDGRSFAALKKMARRADFRPVPLDGRISISFDYAAERVPSKNVLGMIKGRSRPDEYVVYTSHWDHIGMVDAGPGKDGIYNGAFDNATGIAALIEIARTIAAGPPPERSVIFFATTLEEKGLLGARYYAAHPLYPLERTVAAINIDALSPMGPAHNVTVVGYGKSDLDRLLAMELAARKRRILPDTAPEVGAYYRSDHFPFAEKGVPSAFISSGPDLIEGGLAAGEKGWSEIAPRYHQPSDEYDERFRVDGMIEDARFFAALGMDLANSASWPEWNEGTEFRSLRDRSRSARP